MSETVPAAAPPGFFDRLATAAFAVAAVALVGLVAVQGWQVFARYVLNDSPSWTEPATLLLLSTAMSLAAGAGVHVNRHFSFHLLADAAGPRAKRVMRAITETVVAGIGALLAVDAWILAMDGMDIRTAGALWPQGSAYLPLSAGGALMAVFGLRRLLRVLRGEG